MSSNHDGMKTYMQHIGKIPVMQPHEERSMGMLVRGGDDNARIRFVLGNLRLVVKIAHDYKGLGVPIQELISEGNMGLMRAVAKFDPDKGAKFSSYASWWIKQAMRKLLMENGRIIRTPPTTAVKIKKIKAAQSKLARSLGREPTDKEIAGSLDFSVRVVSFLKVSDHRTVSIHDPQLNEHDRQLNEIIPDERSLTPAKLLDEHESTANLKKVLRLLNDREHRILLLRYGLDGSRPRTLDEVSKEIGRTRERVRQIQNRALQKLRTFLGRDYPEGTR